MVVILYSDALMIISIWMAFAVTVEKVLLKTFLAIWLFALHFPKLDGDYCYIHLHSLPFCLGNSKFKTKKNIWTVIYFALPFNVFVNLNFAIFFLLFVIFFLLFVRVCWSEILSSLHGNVYVPNCSNILNILLGYYISDFNIIFLIFGTKCRKF